MQQGCVHWCATPAVMFVFAFDHCHCLNCGTDGFKWVRLEEEKVQNAIKMQYARWHSEAQHRLHDSEAPLHIALTVNGAENEKYPR